MWHVNAGCWICRQPTRKEEVIIRGGGRSFIEVCDHCDFHFFRKDTSSLLCADRLDQLRLLKANLEIPSVQADFENGLRQSETYIHSFMTEEDKFRNILEIGCSWGYFLDRVWKFGGIPSGLELNPVRAHYVRKSLGITCHESLEDLEKSNQKFYKIFGFYVMEYISDPVDYFNRLICLLEEGGEIIFITPNLHDVLKDTWHNPGYIDFFYDECAVGYYSVKAIEKLATKLGKSISLFLYTEQGYSFANHVNWFFTQKPKTTGIVGGDCYIKDIETQIRSAGQNMGEELANMIVEFDTRYRKIIEENAAGNRIIFKLMKRTDEGTI